MGLPITQPGISFHDGRTKLLCDLRGLRKQTYNLQQPMSYFYPGTVFSRSRTVSFPYSKFFLQSYIMRNALLKILNSFRTLKRTVAKVTDSIGLQLCH